MVLRQFPGAARIAAAIAPVAARHEASDKNSVAVYHYLKQNDFDVVYFSLEGGLAHFPTVAKRTGVFPAPPAIVVLAHEPLMWKLEANARAVEQKDQMTVAHMEKTSAETCDHLVVTGQSLLDWMTKAGWKLPASRHIAAPLEPEEWRSNFAVDHYRRASGRQPKLFISRARKRAAD
ncbi:hypothetical protein AJ88_29920 [Mesorhizobium amorphae CCBAU 01583]|nr:hypothetical protein AJ88_29920 [Mesorhizobium amorphae CCBAU 01583]